MTSPIEAGSVNSREDLARYVRSLHAELVGGAEWENGSLDRFLDALAAWISDSSGFLHDTGRSEPSTATWSFLAHALEAATLYE